MSGSSESSREPKPVGDKTGQIEKAARRLFLENGFVATSMEAVAKEAAVSKATLYAYFPSKETLFETLIARQCQFIEQQATVLNLSEGLKPALRKFARQYLGIFLEPNGVAFAKLIANESGRFPKLARSFYESGPMATTHRLARFLKEAESQHLIACGDAVVAAKHFLSLVRGEIPLRAILGIDQYERKQIEMDIEDGLYIFLRAYARSKDRT